MNNSRQNLLSRFFLWWSELCYDHSKVVLALCLIFLAASSTQMIKLRVDISTEAMLKESDPVRTNYKDFKSLFGREDIIILTISNEGLITKPFLNKVHALQSEVEAEVPHIQKITSLINARRSYGEDDELIVEDLLEGFPDYRWSDHALTEHVLQQENYINRLISADGKHLTLVIKLRTFSDTGEALNESHSAETYHALKKVIAQHSALDIALTGEPVLLTLSNELTAEETALMGTAAFIIIIIFMAVIFRRLSGVLAPSFILASAIIGTMGLMGGFDAPFTMTSSAVFALVMGIGVADVVHILTLFYRHYDDGTDKRDAISQAMSHSAPAVFLTTLTTVIGFLSFIIGDLASTADLGIYAAAMVAFALLFTVTLLPCLISLFNLKRLNLKDRDKTLLIKFLVGCGKLGISYPKIISITAILLFMLSIWGISFLAISFDPIAALPNKVEEKLDSYIIDEQIDGIAALEVIIDSGKQNGVYEENFRKKLLLAEEALSNTRLADQDLSKSYSVLDILREVNKSLNSNDTEYYKVPQDRKLFAQEVLLFELSRAEDLDEVIDQERRRIRLSLKIHRADGVKHEKLILAIEENLDNIFQDEYSYVVTGASSLVALSVPKAIRTMAKSYILAGTLIILIIMILIKSFKIGAISIIPNILPITFTMSGMAIIGWHLDMSTIMVGAIAMGLVVDDSLHFLYHFKMNYEKNQDVEESILDTLRTIGPALVITTVIFTSCMMTNFFSSIFSIYMFGSSMSIIAVSALLADIIIAPALLTLVYGKGAYGNKKL